MYRSTLTAIHLKDYLPPEFLIEHVELKFDLQAQDTQVEARLKISRNPLGKFTDGGIQLDGEGLELLEIALDGQVQDASMFTLEDFGLHIHKVPDSFTLYTRVRIHPATNTLLEGLYQSGDMLCTQCEAEGFRHITYFLDRPDVMSTYDVTLIADQKTYPALLANGNLVATESLVDGRHLARWHDPFPKPCYLFAVVAGMLDMVEDHFVTISGRRVTLRIYVEPGNADRCPHAMQSLKNAMRWDEETFGREYDLDIFMIVAVSTFNMGAMENKGLNIFNDKYVLVRPDSATDTDFADVQGVIGHEYFHNWSGNRVTCRDWFQLSLKEGLTVYRDQEFSSAMCNRAVKRITDVKYLRTRQFAEDNSPMAHPVRPQSYIEINNFYTLTVYEKGAELVRMQALLLGPTLFRQATDLYFARHDGQAVTTDDFVKCMEDASGRDLTHFKRWYAQSGTPVLSCSGHYDEQAATYTLTFKQMTPATADQTEKLPLHIPVSMALVGPDGRDMPLKLQGETPVAETTACLLELHEAEETFVFTGIHQRPVPSLLRGFSAPVKLEFAYSDADLLHLMTYDGDSYNRWDAAQTLMQRILLKNIGEHSLVLPDAFIAACERVLADNQIADALKAEILSMPSYSWLANQMQPIDVEGIHEVLLAFQSALGKALVNSWHKFLAKPITKEKEAATWSAVAAGTRKLRNLALAYLAYADQKDAGAYCVAQFSQADNMTDELHALKLLVDNNHPQADWALETFYTRWKALPLVLDKWFALQALATQGNTLKRVRELTTHPDFSLTVPNRVYSLIRSFAQNAMAFHDRHGEGYQFLADVILQLDSANPQLAARMIQPLIDWQRFDQGRQQLMLAQLERIQHTDKLSPNVYEICSRALAGQN